MRTILILSILSVLTACDCVQSVSGTVIDADTKQPIQNANAQKVNKEYDQADTDQNGHFEINSISGGFGCPPMNITISKKGYETITIEIENGGHDTINIKRDNR